MLSTGTHYINIKYDNQLIPKHYFEAEIQAIGQQVTRAIPFHFVSFRFI